MTNLQMPKVEQSILSMKDKIVSDFENILDSKNILFDDDEIKLISEFVTEVEKTFKPRDLVNPSNTAST